MVASVVQELIWRLWMGMMLSDGIRICRTLLVVCDWTASSSLNLVLCLGCLANQRNDRSLVLSSQHHIQSCHCSHEAS